MIPQTSPTAQDRPYWLFDKGLFNACLALVMLDLLDTLTTMIGVDKVGLRELNPVGKYIISHYSYLALFAFTSMFAAAMYCAIRYLLIKSGNKAISKYSAIFMYVLIILKFSVIISNLAFIYFGIR